jgi:DNA-binding response OmpR family regulator
MKPSLLVIDDETAIRRLLQFYFDSKFEVNAFAESEVASTWLKSKQRVDAAIIDMDMPVLNGKDLIKLMRNNQNYAQTPIIVLSGNDKSTERIECLRLGANDYVVKPFNPEELEIRINLLLKK